MTKNLEKFGLFDKPFVRATYAGISTERGKLTPLRIYVRIIVAHVRYQKIMVSKSDRHLMAQDKNRK